MPVDTRKQHISDGLNLGVDPSVTPGLTVADGVRFEELHSVTSSFGRSRLSLLFPYEGVGDINDYFQAISHLKAPDRVLGFAAFYDQRIVTDPPEILGNGSFYNLDETGAPSGWIRSGDFLSATGRLVYIRLSGAGSVRQPGPSGLLGDTKYRLSYSIRLVSGTAPILTIPATFAKSAVTLETTTGTHLVEFTTATSPGDFRIDGVSAVAGQLDIEHLSLRQVEDFRAKDVPERLNVLFKSQHTVYLNTNHPGDGTAIILPNAILRGDTTKAKFVNNGKDVYVIDESTVPLLFRRLPNQIQNGYLKRVRYDLRAASFRWPTPETGRPILTPIDVALGVGHKAGIYRFRIQLENIYGDISGPSLPAATRFGSTTPFDVVRVEFGHLLGGVGADGAVKVNVYFQYLSDESEAAEPTAYILHRSIGVEGRENPSDPFNSVRFLLEDFTDRSQAPVMSVFTGHMPKLHDMTIVNGIAVGIATNDVVYRERSESRADYFSVQLRTVPPGDKLRSPTVIEEIKVSRAFLFVSEPGEPNRMERYIKISQGNELGVGVSSMGDKFVIFTNLGIHMFDQESFGLIRTASQVGCLDRDSIQETERGIMFMGSDGIPRLFNGATVEEVSMQLAPIFDQEDYTGYYKNFDRQRLGEISSASGKRRFYLNYPVKSEQSKQTNKSQQVAPTKNMAIADSSRGAARWSVDTRAVDRIDWFGTESRLAAADSDGAFYYLEEGFGIETVDTDPENPQFVMSARWFGAVGTPNRFYKVSIELDTKGSPVTVKCQIDERPNLQIEFTLQSTERREFRKNLPGTFKGLYCDVRVSGTTTNIGRVKVYDVKVDSMPLGATL